MDQYGAEQSPRKCHTLGEQEIGRALSRKYRSALLAHKSAVSCCSGCWQERSAISHRLPSRGRGRVILEQAVQVGSSNTQSVAEVL